MRSKRAVMSYYSHWKVSSSWNWVRICLDNALFNNYLPILMWGETVHVGIQASGFYLWKMTHLILISRSNVWLAMWQFETTLQLINHLNCISSYGTSLLRYKAKHRLHILDWFAELERSWCWISLALTFWRMVTNHLLHSVRASRRVHYPLHKSSKH